MDKFVFPTINGIVAQQQDKKVVSLILPDGNKKMNSFKEKNRVIFYNFPFLRGVQYFFCGLFALFCAFILSNDLSFKQKVANLKIYYTKRLLILIFVLLLGVAFAAVVLGFVPAKIALLCFDERGSTLLRNLIVLVLKVALFLIFFSTLRVLPGFSEFLRFNRAGDMAILLGDKIKKQKCPPRPLNLLNFLVFVFVLDFCVISFVGAGFGFLLNLLFHIGVFLACMSVCYEILYVQEKCKSLRFLAYPTAIFVYAAPSTTHLECAFVALTELNLLVSQKDRKFMGSEEHAYSVMYSEVRSKLASAGVNDKADADWLIATVLGKNRAESKLVASVSEKQYHDIMRATERRANGESLDNIFGYTEFYGLKFDVNKKVLTPRMETEILVEQVLKAAKNYKKPTILDLGTGSGAIAVSVAKNCPDATITAVDISKTALLTAEGNAKKNDVKIEFLHTNLFEGLKRKRKFDIIVSNPPYIKSADIKKLDKNVRECDPLLALDGGEDGLDFYRAIIPASVKRLNAGGVIMFEVGKGQAAAVRKLLRENGFEDIKTIKDYNKIERIVCGKFR